MSGFKNERVLKLIGKMSVGEKLLCTHGQLWDPYRGNQVGFVRGNERLGIPHLFIADGESGVSVRWETTAFPAKVSLASTFDKKSAYEYGVALGRESKAAGIHVLLSTRVNIARDPISTKGTSNGGNYQTYGEDPVLNGKMGIQEALGTQKDNQAIANLKQMFGSSTGTAQGAGNCIINEQTIHELYMRPFEMVLKAGVGSAMTNYNQVNGTWTYEYGRLTNEYARTQWGFQGFIFNDWFCLYDSNAIRCGVTLEMPGKDYYSEMLPSAEEYVGSEYSCYGKELLDAIADLEQPVTMADLNRAVYYYLDTLERFGFLDEKQRLPGPIDQITKEDSCKVARTIAGKGAVLLKNKDGILPCNFANKKIGIIGPGGAHQVMPTFKESAYGFADRKSSVYELLQSQYGKKTMYAVGNDLDGQVVPSTCLKPFRDSKEHGLKRFISTFTYETLSNGDLEDYEVPANYVVDEIIFYAGEHALPPLPRESAKGFVKEMPKKYYMWSGYLCSQETGWHRISLQSKLPGVGEFEKNDVQNSDLSISTSGNLYIRKAPDGQYLERIGIGTRIFMNGTTDPYSEVVPCKDGWNNAGGSVYLTAGNEYEIYFNHTCICLEPLELRLAWTTPAMALAAEDEAVRVARQSDLVLCFAWHQSVNDSMLLAENQNQLIHKVAAANSQTVVILNNGDPLEMPWQDEVKAILEMWFSGQEGALATMDILTGKVNPAGRLPVTFPRQLTDLAARNSEHPERYAESGRISKKEAIHPNTAHFTEGLLNGYRWFDEKGIEPLYPFGYGLSYTSFEYSNLSITSSNSGYTITCDIKNVGSDDGDEVAQCYLGRPSNLPSGIQCVPKALVDFVRIFIRVGESKSVTFELAEQLLQFYDSNSNSFMLLKGKREILVGSSSRDIRLNGYIVK